MRKILLTGLLILCIAVSVNASQIVGTPASSSVPSNFTATSATFTSVTATMLYGNGSHLSGIAAGGGGADNVAREIVVILKHFGYAYVTNQIDRVSSGYIIGVSSFTVDIDSACVTTPLIYQVVMSSVCSNGRSFAPWYTICSTIAITNSVSSAPAVNVVRRAVVTIFDSLFNTNNANIIPRGARLALNVRQVGGATAPGGNDAVIRIYGHKQ